MKGDLGIQADDQMKWVGRDGQEFPVFDNKLNLIKDAADTDLTPWTILYLENKQLVGICRCSQSFVDVMIYILAENGEVLMLKKKENSDEDANGD